MENFPFGLVLNGLLSVLVALAELRRSQLSTSEMALRACAGAFLSDNRLLSECEDFIFCRLRQSSMFGTAGVPLAPKACTGCASSMNFVMSFDMNGFALCFDNDAFRKLLVELETSSPSRTSSLRPK
jgi:hypothetical protein